VRHLITQWLPYVLYPSAPDEGRPEPELLEVRPGASVSDWRAAIETGTVDVVQSWPLTVVLNILADRAVSWYAQGRQWAAARRKPTTTKEVQDWIATTRSLAARVPIVGQTPQTMLAAAAALDRTLESPRRFFVTNPATVATKADADWRVSLHVWAMDRLLRAVNESEPVHARLRGERATYVEIKPTELWPAFFARSERDDLDAIALPFAEYTEAQKRIVTLKRKIKSRERDPLMIHVLKGALDTGHLNPDGTLRPAQQP
jgi:hypothetical protein